ncbi:MAG: Gfo/Idh/MocA family oxidoreductase [Eubacteriales bacterium]
MLRYGIVSTAAIATRFIEGIRQTKDGAVVAIASRTLESAKEAAERLDIPTYYGSYDQLFTDDKVDVIYIPTVNSLHYRDAKKALLHGKHVLVEKPFVLQEEEAIELFALAKEQNCFIMETQKCIFLPAIIKLKELLEAGTIGDIKYIELKASFPMRFSSYHWMFDLEQGGGCLHGSASYTIELMQFLFHHPSMEATGSFVKCPVGADEICNFNLVMDDEILVSSTITMNVALDNEAVFYGTEGKIKVPSFWKADSVCVIKEKAEPIQYEFPYTSEFVYEIQHVHECIGKGLLESPIMNQEKTIETIKIVNRLYDFSNHK